MIGGGVESITMAKRDSDPNPWVKEHLPGVYMVMGDTAEVVAKRYKISREAQDQYSLLSQQRTARAQQDGFFKEELAPMQVERGILDKTSGQVVGKEPYYVDKDECNRADTTLEGLLKLPPHFDKDSGEGTVTAGNSSQLSDGASSSIGHPFGMTGSRMVGTIANEMARRKARYGVVTMCIGGGQGAAGLFEAA